MSPNPAVLTWPRAVSAPPPAGDPLNPTYITQAVDNTGQTTYTFAGVDIGAAAADRTVVVVFNARISTSITTATTITAATIGGVAATVDYYKHVLPAEQGDNPTGAVGFIRLAVPTGTTATITVTLSAGALRAGISVYTLDAPTTVVASGWNYSATSHVPAVVASLSTAADGALIAGCNLLTTNGTMTPAADHESLIGSNYYHMTTGADTTGAPMSAQVSTPEFAALAAVTYQPA